MGFVRSIGVHLGNDCRFQSLKRGCFGSEPYLISLGDHVTIAREVRFVTHDGGVWVFRQEEPDIDIFGPIIVGNNVFIGIGATILPGVTIGDNCVIGAGAVVTHSIPSNSVAVGVPARVLGSIEEYRTKISQQAFHIRDMSPTKKREILLREYGSLLSQNQ